MVTPHSAHARQGRPHKNVAQERRWGSQGKLDTRRHLAGEPGRGDGVAYSKDMERRISSYVFLFRRPQPDSKEAFHFLFGWYGMHESTFRVRLEGPRKRVCPTLQTILNGA